MKKFNSKGCESMKMKKDIQVLINAVKGYIPKPLEDDIIRCLEIWEPKKVERHGKWSPVRCPTCGKELSHHNGDGVYIDYDWMDYCPNEECHQKLDWK